MNPLPAPIPEPEFVSDLKVNNQLIFAQLYDQYAALLLGVITEIVTDKTEAIALLEVAFSTICLQIDKLQSGKQPLFLQLLQIARSTAIDALKERKGAKTATRQLTETGKVISPAWQKSLSAVPADHPANSIDSQLKELLDSILFKNCTPQEAAISLDMPVETVRQQLRLAMLQLRTTPRD